MNRYAPMMALTYCCVAKLGAVEPNYREWNAVLKKYVSTGIKDGIQTNVVSYAQLNKDPLWQSVQNTFSQFDPKKLNGKKEKIAFWINAYNIAAIRKVLEKYPTNSITSRGEGVWKEAAISIAGRAYSLDEIEHGLLRPLGDARIHFAIVCASLSCPDLRKEAYSGKMLEKQLDSQTRSFLRNATKGVRIENDTLYLSAIFTWFKQDFGDVAKFLARYGVKSTEGLSLREIPYNWKLNEL